MNMNTQQRRAYLEAIGIDVWVPRGEADPEVEVVADDLVGTDQGGAETNILDWDALRAKVSTCTDTGSATPMA